MIKDEAQTNSLTSMKKIKKRIDNDVVITFLRIIAIWLAGLLSKTSITPNQLTIFNFLFFTPLICYFVISGGRTNLLISLALIAMTVIIDLADGALARIKGIFSSYGAWLDGSLDNIFQFLLLAVIVISVNMQESSNFFLVLGIAVLYGQGMAHVLGFTFKYEFGFDFYSGDRAFLNLNTNSILSRFLKNIVVPSSFAYVFIFTARYLLVLGLLLNKLSWFLVIFGLTINIRWISMWFLFYFYLARPYLVPELTEYLHSKKNDY